MGYVVKAPAIVGPDFPLRTAAEWSVRAQQAYLRRTDTP